jgi:hypothetical protein
MEALVEEEWIQACPRHPAQTSLRSLTQGQMREPGG